jgi:predicted ATPase
VDIRQVFPIPDPKKLRENTDIAIFLAPSDTFLFKKIAESIEVEENWNAIIKSGAHVQVAKTVGECVDDKYTELLFHKGIRLRKELPDGNILYIKIDDLGNGLRRAIPIFVWLEAFQPRLVLWDDFEASVHPSLIKQLITWLTKKEWQVVISTQSIDVLSQLLEVKPEDAKVIMLKKMREMFSSTILLTWTILKT